MQNGRQKIVPRTTNGIAIALIMKPSTKKNIDAKLTRITLEIQKQEQQGSLGAYGSPPFY